MVHDVCIQDLPVLFAIDRAGLVGSDGETHQGIFDVSFLNLVPGMSIMAPKNLWELEEMLEFGVNFEGPMAIRYPRGQAYRGLEAFNAPIKYGKAEMLYEEKDIALFALGSMVSTGEHVREKLKNKGYSCTLVNARFVKPFDTEMIDQLCQNHKLIVTLEENVLRGGMGMCITKYIHDKYPNMRVIQVALPDAYVEHGNVTALRAMLGIDSDSVIEQILPVLDSCGIQNTRPVHKD